MDAVIGGKIFSDVIFLPQIDGQAR